MPLADYFTMIDLGPAVDPLTRSLLDEIEAMLDGLEPTQIDRDRSQIGPGTGGISIDIYHILDPGVAIGIEGFGEEVVVNYGEEHEHFDVEHEFVPLGVGPLATDHMVPRVAAFLRALMSGRVELHVTHRILYVKTVSYWINDDGERERFLRGGTVIPTFRWTREPIVKAFDFR